MHCELVCDDEADCSNHVLDRPAASVEICSVTRSNNASVELRDLSNSLAASVCEDSVGSLEMSLDNGSTHSLAASVYEMLTECSSIDTDKCFFTHDSIILGVSPNGSEIKHGSSRPLSRRMTQEVQSSSEIGVVDNNGIIFAEQTYDCTQVRNDLSDDCSISVCSPDSPGAGLEKF